MKCEFSETQFVFGLMHEIISKRLNVGAGWSAPTFPTQREENGLGYDVKIEGKISTIFFQFKVPEIKTKSISKYWSEMGSSPYYVFDIWPDNSTHQHNELVDLANKSPLNHVFYCSPAFHTYNDFNKFYTSEDIAQNSIFIPCRGLSKIAGTTKHDISYNINPKLYIMHSLPQEITGYTFEMFLNSVLNSRNKYNNVESCIRNLCEMFKLTIPKTDSNIEKLDYIARELSLKNDITLLLLSDTPFSV